MCVCVCARNGWSTHRLAKAHASASRVRVDVGVKVQGPLLDDRQVAVAVLAHQALGQARRHTVRARTGARGVEPTKQRVAE